MSNPKKTSKDRMRPEEKEFIRLNCLSMSDESMAEHLKRDIRSIKTVRKAMGVTKTAGGKIENFVVNSKADHANDVVLQASQRLTEDQRKEFFKTQLTNTLYYQTLQNQFTEDEINFYLEEWGALCLQFEDVVATEKRQIDELIKVTIIGNRVMRNVLIAEQEIKVLQEEIETYRDLHTDMANDPEAQEYDASRTALLRMMMGQSQAMTNDYDKNISTKTKILGELNARRRDRVDQLVKRGTTFLGLITAFKDRQTREEHGRHMELVRMAKEKKKSEWRKPIIYEDGTADCILMDEHSILPESKVILLEDMGSRFVEKYACNQNARILIVDNDDRRQQFFAEVFKNHKLEFASNVDKAINNLNEHGFDLVCLDYDLGLEDKGTKLVDYMVEKGLCKDSDILVQSMNKKGSKEMELKLKQTYNKVEVCGFEEIIQMYLKESKEKEIK